MNAAERWRQSNKATGKTVAAVQQQVAAMGSELFEVGLYNPKIQRAVRVIANRAQISRKVSPHVLRHTFSVTAVQKGISLPALQRLLGHDHLATTEIYLNLSPS
jgi:site-specific recombinase XerD